MNFKEKRKKLIDKGLCNHCLGRQFAKVGYGFENYERGAILRNKEDMIELNFSRDDIPKGTKRGGECPLCEGLFNRLDFYENLLLDKLNDYEFDKLLIGVRLPDRIKKKEEDIWNKYGSKEAERLKREFNRLLGKRVLSKLGVGSDFDRSDITAIINIDSNKIDLQISSLLIAGQYNKYSRSISQTKWMHSNNSVQEIVQASAIKLAEAKRAKFHGAGREDLNVRCFGKRDFVLELVVPKKREINLKSLEQMINEGQEQVEVFNLEFVNRDRIREIKSKQVAKTYRALASLEVDVEDEKLASLKKLIGSIKQKTPQRVKRHRADILREREVYKLEVERVAVKKIELIIKAEAGTYIKELISGDEGRTVPSVAQILDSAAQCSKLDVVDID